MSVKYQSHDERAMAEAAMENGWIKIGRNKQSHLVLIHSCGAKYSIPRQIKNPHLMKRVKKQMQKIVEERMQISKNSC